MRKDALLEMRSTWKVFLPKETESSGPQSVSAMVWKEAKENLFEFCADLK